MAQKEQICGSIEAYNSGNIQKVSDLLRKSVDWPDDALIRFFAKKGKVLESTWTTFLRCWDAFLIYEDDAPMVSLTDSFEEIIMFVPLGGVFLCRKARGV